jgi:hypothetical protein
MRANLPHIRGPLVIPGHILTTTALVAGSDLERRLACLLRVQAECRSTFRCVGHRSALASFHVELLTVHMVHHLLIMTVGAPLILLGAPARFRRWFRARSPIECRAAPPIFLIRSAI